LRTIVRYVSGMGKNIDHLHLQQLRDYYRAHHQIPAYSLLGDLLAIRSKASVAALCKRLEAAGYLRRSEGQRWVPTARFFERDVVGRAPAGFASPAAELLGDAITIDEYLVENPSGTVLVRVQGDSMIEAGIHDRDMLVVERKGDTATGKIVVAIVDGEFTVKRLQKDGRGFYLQPANPAYPDIRPEEGLEIFGVVVGQFRKFS